MLDGGLPYLALFRETADGITGARLRLYPGKGHASIATLRHRPAAREILGFLTAGGRDSYRYPRISFLAEHGSGTATTEGHPGVSRWSASSSRGSDRCSSRCQ